MEHKVIRAIKCYLRTVGIRGFASAVKVRITRMPTLLEISWPDIKFPFVLRIPSSDVATCEQIFIDLEYDFNVKGTPRVIVDAGANIGLASIYFANKFPDAKIIAIEPEESNLKVLKRNIAPYENIVPVCGALWHENTRIKLVDTGIGKWGFMTTAQESAEETYGVMVDEVQGVTVDTIMKEQGIDHIDILKVDIEGAEREVFGDSSSWLGKVDALIIELHDHMKPGCSRSVCKGAKGFDNEWLQGENLYLARNCSCVRRHCS
jgi:FkbM family methyltransferase